MLDIFGKNSAIWQQFLYLAFVFRQTCFFSHISVILHSLSLVLVFKFFKINQFIPIAQNHNHIASVGLQSVQ